MLPTTVIVLSKRPTSPAPLILRAQHPCAELTKAIYNDGQSDDAGCWSGSHSMIPVEGVCRLQ